ncbi:hypothetical protein [Phaeobacter sp. S60]|uniref:hypothetical protein n=1 Tax=Phaeobacter sp. S60 TaxID=1569353 RepID=UPI001584F242|nr:hypothetical protein [Phaeobacter sp. S60]
MVSRAFHVAMSGRPGPVVLALPEDMLVEQTVNNPPQLPVAHPARATVTAGDATTLLGALETSTNPMIVVGGGAWSSQARLDLQDFATKWSVPVAVSFRCQDFFDNAHPLYAGDAGIGINPKLAARITSADVVILPGTRFSEMKSSGYSLINIPKPAQHLIHIYPDPDEIGRVYVPDLGIAAPALETISNLLEHSAPKHSAANRQAYSEECNVD